jgi:autotransporter-associated beta strand protein
MDGDFLSNFRTLTNGVAAALTLQAASGNASITVDAGATGNLNLGWNGTGTAGGALILGSNIDIIHNGSGNLTFSRQITGANGLTKTGTGTLIAAAANANSFTGAANFNGGRAIFGNTAITNNDLNSASAVNLGGGTLEIRTTSAVNKTLTPNTTVSAASTLAYNNTAATDQSFTVSTGAMVLNANLTVQNVSSSTNGNNAINITRSLTGSNSLVTDTYNNVSSGAVAFSSGRIQLSGDNSGWNGNLVVAKGTAQYSGAASYAGSGGITIGTTGDAFGAGLGFNSASSDINLTKAITVSTGGTRLIRNNSGTNSSNSITLGGPITLDGNLTLDHAGLGAGKALTVSGNVSGGGGLIVTFVGPYPIASSSVQLSGSNTYTGATAVTSGSLTINGNNSAASGNVTVAAGASLGGTGTIGGATTISGTHNPGTSPGIQSFTSGLVYNSGAVVNWELIGNTASSGNRGTQYDGIDLLGTANLNFAGATTMNLSFNSQGSTVTWSDAFWTANRSWLVYDMGDGVASNFDNLGLNTSNWSDSAAELFNTARPGSSFGLAQTGADIFLVYTVPEPSTYVLLGLAGVALAGRVIARRRQTAR